MNKLTVLRPVLALLALSLGALVACGGDDDGGNPLAPGGSNEQSPDDDSGNTNDDGGNGEDSDGFDFGEGQARVTIGDTTYEFDLTSQFSVCREVFGAIQVAGNSVDNEEISITAWIPPTDWESYDDGRYDPPSIEVEHTDSTTNSQWRADQGRVELIPDWPVESRVENYELNGLRASGTATFIDEYDFDGSREPIQGSFEFACEG